MSNVVLACVFLFDIISAAEMGFSGLWRRVDSKDSRGHCLEKLAKIYTSLPLRYSDLMISPNSF